MKIKVLVKQEGCLPRIIKKGDWIDVMLAQDVELLGPVATTLHWRKKKPEEPERLRKVVFNTAIVPLGICVEMPDGFEAPLILRSSTPKDYGVMQTTGMSLIDNLYKGEQDEWKLPLVALRTTRIPKGTRIAQFRIQLSQKATVWQKLRWLFSSHIEIEEVKALNNPPREGFGSTNNVKTQESQNV